MYAPGKTCATSTSWATSCPAVLAYWPQSCDVDRVGTATSFSADDLAYYCQVSTAWHAFSHPTSAVGSDGRCLGVLLCSLLDSGAELAPWASPAGGAASGDHHVRLTALSATAAVRVHRQQAHSH